jgi:hypothetical protein
MDSYTINSYDVLPGMILEFPALYVSVAFVDRDHESEQVHYNGLVILRDEVVAAKDLSDKVILPTTVPGVHFADDVTVIGSNWDSSVDRFADIVCDRRISQIDGWAPGRRRKPTEDYEEVMVDLRPASHHAFAGSAEVGLDGQPR